jgi:hypothetical protein
MIIWNRRAGKGIAAAATIDFPVLNGDIHSSGVHIIKTNDQTTEQNHKLFVLYKPKEGATVAKG